MTLRTRLSQLQSPPSAKIRRRSFVDDCHVLSTLVDVACHCSTRQLCAETATCLHSLSASQTNWLPMIVGKWGERKRGFETVSRLLEPVGVPHLFRAVASSPYRHCWQAHCNNNNNNNNSKNSISSVTLGHAVNGEAMPHGWPKCAIVFCSVCCLGSDRVYQFPVFTREFCRQLLEEIKHFEADNSLPKGRPNTMNNHGVSGPCFWHIDDSCVYCVV